MNKEFKADHFNNIDDLIKNCELWIRDEDKDDYYRFFDFGAMQELINYIYKLEKELDNIIDFKEMREQAEMEAKEE